jgi:hypothetical protein
MDQDLSKMNTGTIWMMTMIACCTVLLFQLALVRLHIIDAGNDGYNAEIIFVSDDSGFAK